jgi:catechol 2,3-dioxygenase-like lactoylglutathione lyase family enzyme
MAKLRHVAIQCDDPKATAKFYIDVFDMKEMNRLGLEGDNDGGAIYLSDGTINLALIRIVEPDFPNYRPKGLNHIGFVVDNLDDAVARAAAHGARTVRTGHQIREGEFWEHKMVGPDEVGLDLYDVNGRGWPGISGLEELGVKGEITAAAHESGMALADADKR